MRITLWIMMAALAIASCGRGGTDESRPLSPKLADSVATLFNDAVSLSFAGDALRNSDWRKARSLYEQSIAKFRAVVAIEPGHSPAIMTLAHTFYMANQYQSSIDWYTRGLVLQPEFSAGYHEQGMAYLNLGRTARAVTAIEKALSLDSSAEFRRIVISDLRNFGDWLYRKSAARSDDSLRISGQRMAIFAQGVAFTVDTTNRELAAIIADQLRAIGDTASAEHFEKERGKR